MANFSPNINLELPLTPEHYDIGVFNKNNMVIDSEINKLNLKNQSQDESLTAEVTRATERENDIQQILNSEISRATNAEEVLNDTLESVSEHVNNIHIHNNKSVLDKIAEDETGNLLFNGSQLNTGENITPETIGAATENHTHGNMKTITYSTTEPTTVAQGEIVMVYEE